MQEKVPNSEIKIQKNIILKNIEVKAERKEGKLKMSYRGFVSGDKVKIIENIYTVDGTLYKDSIVKIDQIGFPDKDLRIIDNVGKIWYVNYYDIKKYEKE